jgi:LPLT family lysophospholipid transporter-like MFS transporter
MRKGFVPLMVTQFVSALADNALLLVAMALLMAQGQAAFWIPWLKLMFTLSYVILGPWVGVWADNWPKQFVMMVANSVKAVACLGMLLGVDPLLAFALVGVGAAAYAPAKYGLVTELAQPEELVSANAWIEISTVSAVLLGVVLGGALVSTTWLNWGASMGIQSLALPNSTFSASLIALLCMYGLAALLNSWIPGSGKSYERVDWAWSSVWKACWQDQRTLWRDPLGGVSLSVTTLFWGVGATLQLIVLAWAQQQLHLNLSQAAYLQAATAVGVVVGAALAAKTVSLHKATSVLGMGIALGLLLPLMLWVTEWQTAALLTAAIGVVGGFFVVPMNALLQHRGVTLLSAGRSIAVQNVNENTSILLMMAGYSLMIYVQAELSVLVTVFSVAVTLGMSTVVWRYRRLGSPRL